MCEGLEGSVWVPFKDTWVKGRTERSLSQTWAQCARTPTPTPTARWRQGSHQHPQKDFTHILALSAHNILQAGVCDGPFYKGGSRLREVRCLSGDSGSGWPASPMPSYLPCSHTPFGVREESGERPVQCSQGTATHRRLLGCTTAQKGTDKLDAKGGRV